VRTQVLEPALVVDHPAVEPVLEGGAVLGDQQRQVAVVALEPQQQLGQRLRHDRPAHRGLLRVLLDLAHAEDRAVVRRATRFGR
jgi:hypothetical protein